jgi:MEMO1 family protein
MQAFGYISGLDGQGFLDFRENSGATICGAVPIALLLSIAPKGTPVKLLNYSASGELMKDYTNSVSYPASAGTG